MPSVSFFLSTTSHPIDADHPLWHQPLPETRSSRVTASEPVEAEAITYGQYFSAVARFCAAAGWDRLTKAASSMLERPVVENDIERVVIHLEKHGAFYHPARLQLLVGDQTLSLVVNVAASGHGRRSMHNELKALAHLNEQRPFGWLPKVYASARDGLPMFLGDWFDGFHEFHLTRQPGSDLPSIVVWDGADIPCLLSRNQTADVYRRAAMILTACYDPVTACQIFPWHHAAGDFVVRIDGDRTTVRLITVRDYAPMTGSAAQPEDERALLQALVVYFIHLSVRMRLDRIDGVSEVVWAPASCLAPMVEGFFQGLDLTARINGFPEAFPEAFRHYFNHHRASDLMALAGQITRTVFDSRSDERRVVDVHLEEHIDATARILGI